MPGESPTVLEMSDMAKISLVPMIAAYCLKRLARAVYNAARDKTADAAKQTKNPEDKNQKISSA